MNTKVEEALVWLAKVFGSAMFAGILFDVLTDAPRWFTVFAGLWMFDKLDRMESDK